MLLLTRRVGESLYIGNTVKLTILASNGNQIRLGIEAPDDVLILREELVQEIEYPAEATTPVGEK